MTKSLDDLLRTLDLIQRRLEGIHGTYYLGSWPSGVRQIGGESIPLADAMQNPGFWEGSRPKPSRGRQPVQVTAEDIAAAYRDMAEDRDAHARVADTPRPPSQREVAEQLGVRANTLRKRLKRAGTDWPPLGHVVADKDDT